MTKPYWSGFVLSRTETEVDDGTDSPDTSIFGKIRFFLAFMPASLVPPELLSSLTQKKGTNFNKRLHLLNPETHATINGSSTNSGAGRSKRFNFVFIDEAFFIDRFMEIRRSLESVARVRVYVSSVKAGMTQENFKKMCAAKGRYITLSWHDHPWKDQIWYDEKMANIKFDPEIAKEIEVDYSISSVDQYYPEIKSAKICPVQYDPDKPLYVGLDFGKQDLTVMVFAQLNGPYLDIIECYANKEKKAEWYLPFLNPEYVIGDESQYDERHYDTLNRVRSWRRPQYWFGESAHFTKVMPYNMSIADVLRKGGVTLRCNRNAIKYEPRRMATSSLLPKMRFNEESEQVMELKDAVARTRYSKLITGSEGKPMHDGETGDYRSALENLCVNVPLIMRNQREALADEWKGNFYSGLIRYLKI